MRPRLHPVRAFQAPAPGRACGDAWAWSPASGCLTLCDGASFSYDAARWARTAARGFAREEGFNLAGMNSTRDERAWIVLIDYDGLYVPGLVDARVVSALLGVDPSLGVVALHRVLPARVGVGDAAVPHQ